MIDDRNAPSHLLSLRSSRATLLIAGVIAVLVGAGCGASDDTTATPPPTQPTTTTITVSTTHSSPVTTIQLTTTTTPTTTTTTNAADHRFVVGELSPSCPYTEPEPVGPESCVDSLYRAEALAGSEGAAGSGCAPGTSSLPDGMWLGFVTARTAAAIEFDLACIYFWAPGYVEEDSSEDFHNNDLTLRTIAVDPSVPVHVIAPVELGFVTMPFSVWPEDPDLYPMCPSDHCVVWLFINGGEVTEILEQLILNAVRPPP